MRVQTVSRLRGNAAARLRESVLVHLWNNFATFHFVCLLDNLFSL
jgi:hypothetical protein